jgi:DNA-binding NarL/FixJ family response regulator
MERIVPPADIPLPIASALMRIRTLTPREEMVFELLGLGCNNRSIALELHVSERTAKRHITAILAKLGLESRLQAGLTARVRLSLPEQPPGWPEGRMDLLGSSG